MDTQDLDLTGEVDPTELNTQIEKERDWDDRNERPPEFRGEESTEDFDVSDALDNL